LSLQPAFRHHVREGTSFPVAEAVSREIISLPIFPEMQVIEIDAVTGAIREFLG
jgi:dTDP-4-amino-4,6-dideoxygalactose transaminase